MAYTLYSMQDSGNCYKVRLLAAVLGLQLRLIDTDSRDGSTRKPDFLAVNPNGQVPALVLPDGRLLAESNAMLLHLSEGTAYLPDDAYERALSYQWLFFEQYSHEPYIAVVRSWYHLVPNGRVTYADRIPDLRARGYKALDVMETRLAGNDWLADSAFSIADIALYAYTHLAPQGELDLRPYPGISA